MNTNSITALYIAESGQHAPEINTAIKWYLETYLPRQIERAETVKIFWQDARKAAEIDGDTRTARDAEKHETTAGKALDALKKEASDWTKNGGIFLL